ncbi:MAG: GNAT family N-acetyltransferase [Caldilineaceae bacterium]|nr:GNAT family N-acetyltransferase [Caldilineaceae bacterium]
MAEITYRLDCAGVDWAAMKVALVADNFDNGRSPAQLEVSFRNSAVPVIAYAGERIIGTARALSDGICNAYVVDVWTDSAFRKRGVARTMLDLMLEKLPGQHVFLWTDDAEEFYTKIGFKVCNCVGLEKVVGQWLVNST